jgi:hypothetical protein
VVKEHHQFQHVLLGFRLVCVVKRLDADDVLGA